MADYSDAPSNGNSGAGLPSAPTGPAAGGGSYGGGQGDRSPPPAPREYERERERERERSPYRGGGGGGGGARERSPMRRKPPPPPPGRTVRAIQPKIQIHCTDVNWSRPRLPLQTSWAALGCPSEQEISTLRMSSPGTVR